MIHMARHHIGVTAHDVSQKDDLSFRSGSQSVSRPIFFSLSPTALRSSLIAPRFNDAASTMTRLLAASGLQPIHSEWVAWVSSVTIWPGTSWCTWRSLARHPGYNEPFPLPPSDLAYSAALDDHVHILEGYPLCRISLRQAWAGGWSSADTESRPRPEQFRRCSSQSAPWVDKLDK